MRTDSAENESRRFYRDQPVGFFQGEWLTWMLIIVCYGSWAALTYFWREIPTAVLVIAGGYCLALFSSLQHEAVHGHPTRHRNLNLALVRAPLTIWLPVELYERSHRAHHLSELTHPEDDPESWYIQATRWQRLGSVARALYRFNNTFAGRMLIGPWLAVWQCWGGEIRAILDGDLRNLPIWIVHMVGVLLIIAWITLVAGMPVYLYLLAFVWPGISLALVRSFIEHRFNQNPQHRTVIVQGCPVTRLLFLNNNYHWVHHRYPQMPWYRIPACYREQKRDVHRTNGGYAYPGYWTIAWRYLLRPWGAPVYPGTTTAQGGGCRSLGVASYRRFSTMMIAILPMYDFPEVRHATDALWRRMVHHLEREGCVNVPRQLAHHLPVHDLWSDKNLIFSQCCGYDILNRYKSRLQVLGTPWLNAPR